MPAPPSYISAARRDPDGTAIRIALARKVKVNLIAAAERLYVDLLPDTWKGMMPGLPQEVVDELSRRAREAERQLHQQRLAAKQKKPATIRVKVASQPTFTRYVFEMPDTANVVPERADGKLTLNFDQPIKWDLADAKAALPPTLESIEAETDFDSGRRHLHAQRRAGRCALSARTAASWSMSASTAPSPRPKQAAEEARQKRRRTANRARDRAARNRAGEGCRRAGSAAEDRAPPQDRCGRAARRRAAGGKAGKR